jgi:hypothetical protein
MTEPFADEHAPEVAASGGRDPAATESEVEQNGAEPEAGQNGVEADEEVVDGLPVIAEVRTIERPNPASLPAVQAAAAAATGFVAGAATIALIKRRSARKLARNGKGGSRRVADMLPITASRSFLVDVHVIGKQGD